MSLIVRMSGAVVFHIVDHDHKRRAQLARCAFEIGHHAEVYSDSAELEARPPREGVVIALEDAIDGDVRNLLGLLNRDGRWLTVVATSVEPTLAKAVEAVEQGAADYLALPIDGSDLARTLSRLASGPSAPQLRARRRTRARQRLARLSRREFEVLEHMALGMTNKEIGSELGISARTVEIHRTNALTKLKCGHSTDALRIWFESELEDDRQDFALAS
ncbi:MAG TPA: LuxR C-terminal-related transcriptional regulator [Reyranella sp.]|nr:LuxR C-terminal-related transcriptional regulator [Reyranella sp.]